jgi:NAD(P)-dependent dehydrogenase (short-subunit alcohol dehydrogenase family)
MRLNETAAAELKDTGVRMNAIAPGAVNTRFLEDLLKAGPKKAGKENYERALRQKDSGGVSPEKAARLCVWLASDASIGITGKIFSAQWDPYENFPQRIVDLMSTDIYTMRRVRPKDRGFDWDPFDPIKK